MTAMNKYSTGPIIGTGKKTFPMQLIRLIVCVSVLAPKVCWAALVIKTSKLDESRLVEASIDILESCYTDRFSTVGLAGPSAGSLMTKMSSRENVIPVTMIDEPSRAQSHVPVKRGSRYKLQVFAITTTNQTALVKTLTQVRASKYWNHMASYLLIDWPAIETGCSNAYKVLWEAWKMNLLNSKFVCLHQKRGQLIYTFNPYTREAPAPWQQESTYEGMNGHIWTLFVREYREDESCCDKLDFDKTIDLGGYEIRASVKGMERWWNADPYIHPDLLNRLENVTAQILMSALNATWKLLLQRLDGNEIVGAGTEIRYNWIKTIDHEISDICLNIYTQDFHNNRETTYPLSEDYLAILTQYPGHKSQLDKIISVLDRSSRFGVFMVFMITLLFFKFWLGKPLIASILDLVLILCNAALRKIPEKLAPRIYLATLFMFVVTLQGIYQGQFASLLTKEVRLPAVNTIEDLAHSNHKIYSPAQYEPLVNESVFKGRYFVSDYACAYNVFIDSKAACVEVKTELLSWAAYNNLHLSRETMGLLHRVYFIRRDWPLEERVNMIFGSLVAAGTMDHLYNRERGSEIRRIERYKNQEQDPRPKVLTLRHLTFAFVMLGIGLGCATITFIIEVVFFRTAIKNPRNRIRRRVNRMRQQSTTVGTQIRLPPFVIVKSYFRVADPTCRVAT